MHNYLRNELGRAEHSDEEPSEATAAIDTQANNEPSILETIVEAFEQSDNDAQDNEKLPSEFVDDTNAVNDEPSDSTTTSRYPVAEVNNEQKNTASRYPVADIDYAQANAQATVESANEIYDPINDEESEAVFDDTANSVVTNNAVVDAMKADPPVTPGPITLAAVPTHPHHHHHHHGNHHGNHHGHGHGHHHGHGHGHGHNNNYAPSSNTGNGNIHNNNILSTTNGNSRELIFFILNSAYY